MDVPQREITGPHPPAGGRHAAPELLSRTSAPTPRPQGLGLVFVAVYQKALSLLYVDELLQAAKDEFCTSYYKPGALSYKPAFDDTFNRLMKQAEASAEQSKRGTGQTGPKPAGGAAKVRPCPWPDGTCCARSGAWTGTACAHARRMG